MILFNIIQNDDTRINQICDYVIESKFALHTHIDTNELYSGDQSIKTIRIFFLTKALLYDTIEKAVIEKFYHKSMIIYATPVSHINEEFGVKLRERLITK